METDASIARERLNLSMINGTRWTCNCLPCTLLRWKDGSIERFCYGFLPPQVNTTWRDDDNSDYELDDGAESDAESSASTRGERGVENTSTKMIGSRRPMTRLTVTAGMKWAISSLLHFYTFYLKFIMICMRACVTHSLGYLQWDGEVEKVDAVRQRLENDHSWPRNPSSILHRNKTAIGPKLVDYRYRALYYWQASDIFIGQWCRFIDFDSHCAFNRRYPMVTRKLFDKCYFYQRDFLQIWETVRMWRKR